MTGQVRATGSAAAIPGSYVVVLKDSSVSSSAVGSTASSMATRYGGKVQRSWGVALRGFEFTGSSLSARRLAADPSVAYVEQNQVFRVDDTQQNATFGLDRIDQRNLPVDGTYTFSTTASNVHAYVIDTGIRLTHADFGGRATSGADFVDNDTDATDCNGHGTHVSGTIGGTTFGVAKQIQLVAVRVLDCNGSGSTAGVIAGVNFVTQNAIHPAVANMSLGGGVSKALDDAVQNSIDSGVTYAIAAGNDGANACNTSPARVTGALTVGATQQDDTRASFSNIGRCVDIFAPGVNITSDFLDSDTATAVLSGTSMSTPHVAGGAALFLATHPTASPAEVATALTSAATTGVVGDPGKHSPDRLLFVS
ncbi:MAG: S8 family peptidase [Micromonosporaceae bacterium]|nr:S8 family peptidase [Micromonosporaceae bacterium]